MSAPTVNATVSPPQPASFQQAVAFWLKLGFISFNGPAGKISIMHQGLVENKRWISERWRRLICIAIVGLLLWLIPMSLLTGLYGWGHTLT